VANYIIALRDDLAEERARIARMEERAQEFREHLALPKYCEPATDGGRVDWIATADVARWLRYILEA
jgi:hypothetical protein